MNDISAVSNREDAVSIHDRFVRGLVVLGASSLAMQIANNILFGLFGPTPPNIMASERWLKTGGPSARAIEITAAAMTPLALLTAVVMRTFWDSGPFATLYNMIHFVQVLGRWAGVALLGLCLIPCWRMVSCRGRA